MKRSVGGVVAKSGGITPTTVWGRPPSVIVVPTTERLAANRRRHRPFERIATSGPPTTSCSGGLGRADAATLNNEFGKTVDLRRLRPGHLLRFHYDAAGTVDSVEMKVTGWGEIDAVRDGARLRRSRRSQAQQTRDRDDRLRARSTRSLYEALRDAGEGAAARAAARRRLPVGHRLLRAAEGRLVQPRREEEVRRHRCRRLRPDRRRALHARRHRRSKPSAARRRRPRRLLRAATAAPLRKQFLRAPLQFTPHHLGLLRSSRFHPAPALLPPASRRRLRRAGRNAGDDHRRRRGGRRRRYNRGEGNFVRIRHTSRIETSYLHLSRFAKGHQAAARR